MKIQLLWERVDRKLHYLEQYVEDLFLGFNALSCERLLMQLFPPKKLAEVLKEIAEQLPKDWALAIPAVPENVWLHYQQTRVSTAITKDNGIRMFIHVPIYEVKYKFNFYRIFNVPLYNAQSDFGLMQRFPTFYSQYPPRKNVKSIFPPNSNFVKEKLAI